MIRFFWSHVGLAVLFCTVSTGTIIHVPAEQPTIQAGIDAANHGDTVLVDTGRYVENINFNGKNLILGSWFLVTGDTSYISQTVIDGDSSGTVVTFENGEDSTAVLSGFTITKGLSVRGGGIYCTNSSPSFENVLVNKNMADNNGGGIYFVNSNAKLTNVTISSNTALLGGGGIYCKDSNITIVYCIITSNSADYGGGIVLSTSLEFSSLAYFGWPLTIINNVTMSRNNASYGGGLFCSNGSSPILVNTILWGDSPQEIYFDESAYWPSSVTIAYSDVQAGREGIVTNDNGTVNWLDGNIKIDPLFVDPMNSDFDLKEESPCIDAGTARFVWEGDTLINLMSNDYHGTAPDMGAFESTHVRTYFPLNVGDERQFYWIWTVSTDTIFEPVEYVFDTVFFEGQTYFAYGSDSLYPYYYRRDPKGNIHRYFDWESGKGETTWFRFDVAKGDTYHVTLHFLDSTEYYVVQVLTRNATVETRAGTFSHCIGLFFDNPKYFDEETWFWFAPDVGIVLNEGVWIRNVRLYYAWVGGILYPPGPVSVRQEGEMPTKFRLAWPFPNPFNPVTTIQYDLPRSGYVSLTIYDVLGRQVEVAVDSWQEAGRYSVVWDAIDVPTGIYFVRMISGSFSQVRKVMVLK